MRLDGVVGGCGGSIWDEKLVSIGWGSWSLGSGAVQQEVKVSRRG